MISKGCHDNDRITRCTSLWELDIRIRPLDVVVEARFDPKSLLNVILEGKSGPDVSHLHSNELSHVLDISGHDDVGNDLELDSD